MSVDAPAVLRDFALRRDLSYRREDAAGLQHCYVYSHDGGVPLCVPVAIGR